MDLKLFLDYFLGGTSYFFSLLECVLSDKLFCGVAQVGAHAIFRFYESGPLITHHNYEFFFVIFFSLAKNASPVKFWGPSDDFRYRPWTASNWTNFCTFNQT